MATFLRYANMKSEEDILKCMQNMTQSGTLIKISNLKRPMEFEFTKDDIR